MKIKMSASLYNERIGFNLCIDDDLSKKLHLNVDDVFILLFAENENSPFGTQYHTNQFRVFSSEKSIYRMFQN